MIRRKAKQDPLFAKVEAAFAKASKKVVARAKQTGTPLVLWKDERVVLVPADEFDLDLESGKSDADAST